MTGPSPRRNPPITTTGPQERAGNEIEAVTIAGGSLTRPTGQLGAPAPLLPTPTPYNAYNEIAQAEAKQRKAQGRLATIYTNQFGIAPNTPVSLARRMLTGV